MTKSTRPSPRRRAATGEHTDKPRRDVYAEITDQIVAALDAGTVPWHKPWNAGNGISRSLSSGKVYRGLNPFLLAMTAAAKGYTSPWWGTYRQIAERGGQVRKGEKSTVVVFWKILDVDDPERPGKTKKVFLLRTFNVFNVQQADPADPGTPIRLPRKDAQLHGNDNAHERIAACDAALAAYYARPDAPSLGTGGDQAYYSPSRDHVQLPELSTFESPESYHGATFHETCHSTGHSSRLNREGVVEGHAFGDPLYSREELIAEMGAAYLAGMTGIDAVTLPNSAAYLQAWIKVLRGDKKLVVQAASAAQKAAEFILGAEDETTDDESAAAAPAVAGA